MREVSEFVVVLPVNLVGVGEAAIEWVERRLMGAFPHYSFRVEALGPFQDEEEFQVIPIMGKVGDEFSATDEVYLCKPLEPWVIPAIKEALGKKVH